MPASCALLLSCEHGGNRVPARYRPLFVKAQGALASHAGSDIGALAIARHLHRQLGAPLIAATTTRLLVDLNRSRRHPRLFSAWTRTLPAREKARIIARHYEPYRARVEAAIRDLQRSADRVLHISVHSFAGTLDGITRNADIGLLYDPARRHERAFCLALAAELCRAHSGLRVRRNYPYRGVADGLVTALRKVHGPQRYSGIELEFNQAVLQRPGGLRQLAHAMTTALNALV